MSAGCAADRIGRATSCSWCSGVTAAGGRAEHAKRAPCIAHRAKRRSVERDTVRGRLNKQIGRELGISGDHREGASRPGDGRRRAQSLLDPSTWQPAWALR